MNNSKPLVSACIITYNQEQYIAECIEGALNQYVDGFDYEIIIGEDKSTDRTLQICEDYAARYPDKIRIIKRANNLGMTGNWIETITACEGKYIALCEGDDYWTDPLKIKRQVEFMEHNTDFSMCFHNVYVAENKTTTDIKLPERLSKDVYTTEDLADKWFYPTCSILFRKSAVLPFPSWFIKVKSADMALVHILSGSGKLKYINETMGVYRLHPGGISNTHTRKARLNGRKELFSFLDEFFEHKFHQSFNKGLAREYVRYLNEWRQELSFYEIMQCEFRIAKYNAPDILKHKIVYYTQYFFPVAVKWYLGFKNSIQGKRNK
jgi:glycosyltransferase involved in cell wall biosynthesis